MGNSVQAWRVPVPKGWAAFTVPGDEPVPKKQRSGYDELRFRPPDEDETGRLQPAGEDRSTTTCPASAMVAQRLAAVREAYPEVDVLDRATDSVKFTFRDGANHLRYNFFRYFTGPQSSEASLEMSVAGRRADEAGLEALFAAFASTLEEAG